MAIYYGNNRSHNEPQRIENHSVAVINSKMARCSENHFSKEIINPFHLKTNQGIADENPS